MLKFLAIQTRKESYFFLLVLFVTFFPSCSIKKATYYKEGTTRANGHSRAVCVRPMWRVVNLFFEPAQDKIYVEPEDYEKWLRKFNKKKNRNFTIIQAAPQKNEVYIIQKHNLEMFWKTEPNENWLERPNNPDKIWITDVKIIDLNNNDGVIDPYEDARVEVTIFNADSLVFKLPTAHLYLEGHTSGLKFKWVIWPTHDYISSIRPGHSLTLVAKIPHSLTFESGTFSCLAKIRVERKVVSKQSEPIVRAAFFDSASDFEPIISFQEDQKRREAINTLYGKGKVSNEAIVQIIEEGVLIGDDKAKMWKAILMIERPIVYPPSASSTTDKEDLVKDAINTIIEGAAKKDLESLFLLSRAHFYGLGVAEDIDLASKYLVVALEGGYVPAQIARCADLIRTRNEAAATSIQKLADTGSSYGLFLLGQVYHFGLNGTVNEQKALELYRQANDLGIEEAKYLVGLINNDRSKVTSAGIRGRGGWYFDRSNMVTCQRTPVELNIHRMTIELFCAGIYIETRIIEKHEVCDDYDYISRFATNVTYRIPGIEKHFGSADLAIAYLIRPWRD